MNNLIQFPQHVTRTLINIAEHTSAHFNLGSYNSELRDIQLRVDAMTVEAAAPVASSVYGPLAAGSNFIIVLSSDINALPHNRALLNVRNTKRDIALQEFAARAPEICRAVVAQHLHGSCTLIPSCSESQ